MRGERYPLTDDTAVLVNAWEPHCYAHHDPEAPRTVILALYIEPAWLAQIQRPLSVSGYPGFFPKACVQIARPMPQPLRGPGAFGAARRCGGLP